VSCTDEKDPDTGDTLEKPTLLLPSNGSLYGANSQFVLFDWSDVEGAYKYSIEIKDVFTSSVIFSSDATDSEIQVSREEFYNLDTYSWTVTAYSSTNETAVSGLQGFTYEFGQLQLQIPSNNAILPTTTSSITLQCENVDYMGLTGYRFTVYRDGGFLVTQQTSVTNTFNLTGLTSGTTYTWDVSAERSAGGGIPSDTWSFSVQ
jgi:hypothetical protein